MRVLITGGAGFIGSHICDSLLADGHEVLVIDDLSSGFKENVSEGAQFVEASFDSDEGLAKVEEFRPEFVVHAAAQISVRISMEDPSLDAEVNVKAFLKFLAKLSSQDPKPHVTFLSTGGAMYGEADLVPTAESFEPSPESLYGLHKRFGELYLDFWMRMSGMTFTALRLANVYGPRQNPHGEAGVVAIFSERLHKGEVCKIFGSGEQTRDFIYVGDVVKAVSRTAQRVSTNAPSVGVFNVGTGEEVSVNVLFEQMKSISGSESPLEYAPARSGEQQRSAIDASRFGEEFKWKPEQTLSSGLELTLDWFKERL